MKPPLLVAQRQQPLECHEHKKFLFSNTRGQRLFWGSSAAKCAVESYCMEVTLKSNSLGVSLSLLVRNEFLTVFSLHPLQYMPDLEARLLIL